MLQSLQSFACVAVMFGGAILLTIGVYLDYGAPITRFVPEKFPSHIELAAAATFLGAFAVAGWMAGGMQ